MNQRVELLVGRSLLGTINHCLLSIEALRRRDVPLCGLVLNRLTDAAPSRSAARRAARCT